MWLQIRAALILISTISCRTQSPESRKEEVVFQVITAAVICNIYQCQSQSYCCLVRWAHEALVVDFTLRLRNCIFNAPTVMVASREPHDQSHSGCRSVNYLRVPAAPVRRRRAEQNNAALRWFVGSAAHNLELND